MPANVLEFALGLQVSDFLEKLGFASDEILSLAGLAELVRKAWEQTWSAMEKGAELRALSSATNESVSNLYKFEHGLEAIGGQTQSLSMFFMMTQKALSGVNEAGQRTDMMFSALGLNIGKLRGEDTVRAITDIAGSLNKLNPTQAAGVAESLFGRFQAQSILQIARNMDMFQGGMGEGSNTAALLDKFAKTFEEVKAAAGDIHADFLGIWTAVAGGLAPEVEKLFKTIHDNIKNIGPEISGAIQGGHIKELLSLSGQAALEEIGIYGQKVFEVLAIGFGDALIAAVRVVFTDVVPHLWGKIKDELQAGEGLAAITALDSQLKAAQQQLGATTDPKQRAALQNQIKQLGAQIGYDQSVVSSLQGKNDADFNSRVGDAVAMAGSLVPQLMSHIDKQWAAGNFSGPAARRLKAFLHLMKNAGLAGDSNAATGSPAPGAISGLTESHYRPEFTTLEKMGFVMRGAGHVDLQQRQVDLLQTIAHNTAPRGGIVASQAPNPTLGDWHTRPFSQNIV